MSVSKLLEKVDGVLESLKMKYEDFHKNPELSMQEIETGKKVVNYLKELGLEVYEGGGGVVGVIKNGDGACIMMRADMDALPMKEQTDLPFASKKEAKNAKGETVCVSHMCGHDMHMSWLLGACEILIQNKNEWQGTILATFQPGEENGEGSQSMLDSKVFDNLPKPEAIFGQHLIQFKAGTIGYKPGQILTAGDSWMVKFFGVGAHGGMPHLGIDPIVMASHAVTRIQSIVSREVAPNEQAVITIGEFHAGTAENIIANEAYIKLNIRTTNELVREHILNAIKRICKAEALASNAPKEPEFIELSNFPLTYNDEELTEKVSKAFKDEFKEDVFVTNPLGASEDFSRFGRAWKVPYIYWFVGGTEPAKYEEAKKKNALSSLPGPHSPYWAPYLPITLKRGIETILVASNTYIAKEK